MIMRISEGQLRTLIRRSIRKALNEEFADITPIVVRLRIKIAAPSDPGVLDILTSIRGLDDVITVTQLDPMDPAPEGKKMINLKVAIELKGEFDPEELKKKLLAINGVDMVMVKGRAEDVLPAKPDNEIVAPDSVDKPAPTTSPAAPSAPKAV
jgi:hypothetical protein